MSLASVLAQLSTGGGLPKRFRPYANQAANEAFLRFAPEWDQLGAVRQQSAQTMRQNVGQANSAAQLISALANQSQQTLNSSANPLVQRLAAYDHPPANSSAAVVAQNLGLTHDATSSMLAQAATNAPLRAQQQGIQALTQHQQDLSKINAQRASLAGQVGAFTQGRLEGLVTTDRTNRAKVSAQRRQIESQLTQTQLRDETTRRGQDIASADRQAAVQQRRDAANKPSSPKSMVTPAQATKFTSQANQVADILMNPPPLQGGGKATRAQILQEIRSGTSPLGKGVDPRVVHIGVSLADNKNAGIGPWGLKNARDLGIPVRWKVLPRPKRSAPGPSLGPAGPLS